MANRVTMDICGQEYTLVAEESASYMEKVGAMVDKKMRELMDSAHVSRSDAAVLAAILFGEVPTALQLLGGGLILGGVLYYSRLEGEK